MKITNTIQTRIAIWQKQVVWEDFRPILVGAITLFLLVAFGERITILQPLRILLGLIYVLFIPGYCLTTTLFPRINDLDSIERLGLSIGFSVAFVSILALVLDWLHWGLYPWPILLSQLGLIGLSIALTLWRRSQLSLDVVDIPKISWRSSRNFGSVANRRLYSVLMIGLITLGLAVWAFLTPMSDRYATEFYILGSEGLVEGYPSEIKLNDEVQVNIGVINRENSELNYHFEVWVTDNLNLDKRKRVMLSDSFSLRPDEKIERSVSWYMPWVGEDQKIELLLLYDDELEPSRELDMWINVRE